PAQCSPVACEAARQQLTAPAVERAKTDGFRGEQISTARNPPVAVLILLEFELPGGCRELAVKDLHVNGNLVVVEARFGDHLFPTFRADTDRTRVFRLAIP